MSNEKKNLQQNPSRYFRVLTAVLFLADVVLAPWLREGNRSFSVRVFIQGVKAAGGIEKFALTEAGKGNTEGIANLTMNYWCIYLIIVLGAALVLSAPFAVLLPFLRMFRRSQSLLYLRNLLGLGGGTMAVLLLVLMMLTRYYRRVNR